jgi:hypothetical protein
MTVQPSANLRQLAEPNEALSPRGFRAKGQNGDQTFSIATCRGFRLTSNWTRLPWALSGKGDGRIDYKKGQIIGPEVGADSGVETGY